LAQQSPGFKKKHCGASGGEGFSVFFVFTEPLAWPDITALKCRRDMHIRDAIPTDLPAIVAIYNASVPTRMVTADTEPVSVESRQKWFQDHTPQRRPLWVAEENGQIAGWLSYSSFHTRPAYSATCELSIYIAAEHRRRGLGAQLLARSIEHGPKIGVKVLIGLIFGHNQPSLRLFEKFGFQRWGHLPCIAILDGVERDVVIVGRRC
jgi:phosphinothricin acetyltransferase